MHSLTTLLQLMGGRRASLPLARQRALERAVDTQAVDVGLARLADAVDAAYHLQLGRQVELRLEDDDVARAREREPRGVTLRGEQQRLQLGLRLEGRERVLRRRAARRRAAHAVHHACRVQQAHLLTVGVGDGTTVGLGVGVAVGLGVGLRAGVGVGAAARVGAEVGVGAEVRACSRRTVGSSRVYTTAFASAAFASPARSRSSSRTACSTRDPQ